MIPKYVVVVSQKIAGKSRHMRERLDIDSDDQGQDAYLLRVAPKYGLADVLNEEMGPIEAMNEAKAWSIHFIWWKGSFWG